MKTRIFVDRVALDRALEHGDARRVESAVRSALIGRLAHGGVGWVGLNPDRVARLVADALHRKAGR